MKRHLTICYVGRAAGGAGARPRERVPMGSVSFLPSPRQMVCPVCAAGVKWVVGLDLTVCFGCAEILARGDGGLVRIATGGDFASLDAGDVQTVRACATLIQAYFIDLDAEVLRSVRKWARATTLSARAPAVVGELVTTNGRTIVEVHRSIFRLARAGALVLGISSAAVPPHERAMCPRNNEAIFSILRVHG